MYQWGLTAKTIAANAGALETELPMLEPLVDREAYKRWKDLLEQNDPRLYRELRDFWGQLDPTPATRYNERLLEHWERIAYARREFTRAAEPPYDTDERGPAWVRYGAPDRQYQGRFLITPGDVAGVCRQLKKCDGSVMANAIMGLDHQPYYELWIYRRPNTEMRYNLVLIFGDSPTSGFGRVETIDDLIPSRAFSFSDRYAAPSLLYELEFKAGKKMSPGMVMQWIYYRQLATKDFYFADRFDRMVFEWDRADPNNPYLGKHAGPMHAQRARMVTLQNLKKAPGQISTYENAFPAIPLEVFQYRLLDERGRPMLATFLESNAQRVFIEDLAASQDSMAAGGPVGAQEIFSYYELIHGLQLKSIDGRLLARDRRPVVLRLDSTNTLPSASVFIVPYGPEPARQVLYAELHNRHPGTSPRYQTPFPRSLRGLGKVEVAQPAPLSTDPGVLGMGDLILGYGLREQAPADRLFPFVVATDGQIPEGEALVVHLEVYHLQAGPDGMGRFQLDYQILPVNWLGWTQERQQELSLTLNVETAGWRYAEDLSIQTRRLGAGRHVLRMQATDPATGQQVEREVEFEVVEE